jgi:GNAT superfamily N-acetyltransferase
MQSGKISTRITYLEMRNEPANLEIRQPLNTEFIRVIDPPVHFYRYLYNTVGEQWLWYERRKITDEELVELIYRDNIAIYVLYVKGIPAGYSELDFQKNDTNLVYFGLMPEFIGKGYGKYFLNQTIKEAWSKKNNRLWVHTCTLDAPNAMEFYQMAGFNIYGTEDKEIHI